MPNVVRITLGVASNDEQLGGLPSNTMTNLIAPDGAGGDMYVTSSNFKVLMRYNPSVFYALSITSLAEHLCIH